MPTVIDVVVLAAGKGTRMRSALPKVLHPVADRPMLGHVLRVIDVLAKNHTTISTHVVYGHGGDQVRETFPDVNVNWVLQSEQRGTGHAVQQAMPHIADDSRVLVLCGDVPLLLSSTVTNLLGAGSSSTVSLLTVDVADPSGYGRIIRDACGAVTGIVEEKDADEQQKKITETNTGILVAPAKFLRSWLSMLRDDNAQGELYLTDIIELAVADGIPIHTVNPVDEFEVMGINNKLQLAEAERVYQRRQVESLMVSGATLRDPKRLDIRGEVTVGQDVEIDVNVVLSGKVTIGSNVTIGPNCVIIDSTIGDNAIIHPNSMLEDAVVGSECSVGPYARLRPQTILAGGARIGNFVEVKKSTIGEGSKANHLAYIGDAEVGDYANIGAGVITCNYDGANKHKTVVGDGAFVGSNCELVAPVTIGPDATIGAGTTLVDDAPAGQLTLSRVEQKTLKGWVRPINRPKS